MVRNNLIPTLKDAVPGDLSLVFPHRIMVDIDEMIQALDKVTPGIASDETLLYGVEVKFYSNKVVTTKEFETNIKGLRVMGDGAAITRGLQQASANGCIPHDASWTEWKKKDRNRENKRNSLFSRPKNGILYINR